MTEPSTESCVCNVCVLPIICVFVTQWLCFPAGCYKPGVPGEKGLPCTSIRNHSSGEETFLVPLTPQCSKNIYFYKKSWYMIHMAENKERITPSNRRKGRPLVVIEVNSSWRDLHCVMFIVRIYQSVLCLYRSMSSSLNPPMRSGYPIRPYSTPTRRW